MKRYSIASSSSRRKSTANPGYNNRDDNGSINNLNHNSNATINNNQNSTNSNNSMEPATLELERLEQEITLVLQEIDKNLSKANAVINDKIYPVLKNYGKASSKVWSNVNFWKFFMEQAANVELTGYEEPANPNTDSNTLNNARSSNLLLLEDEDDEENLPPPAPTNNDNPNDIDGTNKETEGDPLSTSSFKVPIGRTFHNIEETPTWSVEQKQQPSQAPQGNSIHASTPQMKKRTSILRSTTSGGGNGGSARFESSDSLKFQPPPTLTEGTSSANSSPKITHTIRQSLDNYHKVSISPRKNNPRNTRTPIRGGDGRSSMIQNFIESSPTLPEPPVLLSELKNGDNGKSGSPSTYEKLSPVHLPEPSPDRRKSSNTNTIQRFPTTPKYGSSAGDVGVDIMRTPVGIRAKYGNDDSDIPPPNFSNIEPENEPASIHNSDSLIPQLQTVELSKKRNIQEVDHENSKEQTAQGDHNNEQDDNDDGKDLNRKRQNILDDNEDNVFLDNSAKQGGGGSAASTVYHSVVLKQSNNSTNHSATYNLFQEVLENSGNLSKNKESETSQTKDLFGDVLPKETGENEEDITGNSTGGMGSFLGERFRNFTK